MIKKQKVCTVFLSSYRNTSGNLGKALGTAFSPKLSLVLRYYNSIETRRICSISFRKQYDEKRKTVCLC